MTRFHIWPSHCCFKHCIKFVSVTKRAWK